MGASRNWRVASTPGDDIVPNPLVRSALLALVLLATGAGGFALGRANCTAPFDAYREVRARVLAHQSAQPADGAVLLLGSSTLERLNAARLGVSTTNLALGGDTIVDVLARLPAQDVLARSAGAVVLAGYNDLVQGATPDQALANYDRLLRALEPVRFTVCTTLQPLSPEARTANPALDSRIGAFNDGVRERCDGGDGRTLVDLEQSLRGVRPSSPAALYVDEIHLSPGGYDVFVAALTDALQQVPRPGA